MRIEDMLKEIDEMEADMLEPEINTSLEERLLENQEKLAMNKIRAQIQQDAKVSKKHFRLFRKKVVVFIAVTIMMVGMMTCAKEYDWDIKMANTLGISDVMEELEGGYVKIGQSDENDGIVVTASQSIGDQNSQWIQIDTNVPWGVGEEGYYMFDNFAFHFLGKDGRQISGGSTFYSYNQDGYISFMIYAVNVENINRAKVEIKLEKLREYQDKDQEWEEGILISEGSWELQWKNQYATNIITKHPFKKVSLVGDDGIEYDALLHKIEISPISIRAEMWKNPKVGDTENCRPEIESITLTDGTEIDCKNMGCGGNTNNWKLDKFISFEEGEKINMYDIDYITVGGENIYIQ